MEEEEEEEDEEVVVVDVEEAVVKEKKEERNLQHRVRLNISHSVVVLEWINPPLMEFLYCCTTSEQYIPNSQEWTASINFDHECK